MDKSVADFKATVEKSLIDFKSSVEVNAKIVGLSFQFQEFDSCLDVVEMRVEVEMQPTADHKEITKHELESSGKILRIQNLPFDKDEVIYTLTAELSAPILNLTPQDLT